MPGASLIDSAGFVFLEHSYVTWGPDYWDQWNNIDPLIINCSTLHKKTKWWNVWDPKLQINFYYSGLRPEVFENVLLNSPEYSLCNFHIQYIHNYHILYTAWIIIVFSVSYVDFSCITSFWVCLMWIIPLLNVCLSVQWKSESRRLTT